MPNVLIVNSIGPQGPVGPQGPAGPTGSFDTGSLVTTGSFNAFTGSYNTGSFTGSFTGDGSGLYNIPSSGITGLNLSQIASGSVTASISPSAGFRVNTNTVITGSLTIQPTSSATQVVAIIQAGSGSLALIPSGSGAIVASIPDGTAVGGNARGSYAVDLQRIRSASNRVADGDFSVIVGGQSNGMNGLCTDSFIGGGKNNFMDYFTQRCVIVGGENNGLYNNTNHSFIGGGLANYVSVGDYAVVTGGGSNSASSNYSVVSGGQSNTASTNTHATVVGGLSNVASGQYSTAGGQNNTASGNKSTVFGGPYSTASGDASLAIGWANVASGNYAVALNSNNAASGVASIALGYESKAYLDYSQTLASTKISTQGDAQATTYVTRTSSALTSAATASLAIGGGYTPGIPNGNNRTWHTVVDTVAVVTAISGSATGVTVGDSFMQTDKLLFKRISGTSSVVGRSTTETIYDTSMSTALMSFTAGSSQELAITFTAPTFAGGGSITCRVVSKVSLVEVAY